MSLRRRLLRIAVIVVLILLVTGYGAVSTLLISPLEGEYDFDVSTLIPRDVDFYVSKADLAEDFDPFPRFAFLDDFEACRGGQAVSQTETYESVLSGLDLGATLAQIDGMMEQLPIETSPLSLFGGQDVAIAGYFRGEDLANAKWAIYGRTSWPGRIGVALLRYPDAIGLTDQGMVVTPLENEQKDTIGHSLAGGQLTVPLYVTRILDVVVVSNTQELMEQAVELDAIRGENSLGMSARYADHIDVSDREGDELEVYVDHRMLAENMAWTGEWPDPFSDSLLSSFCGKLFQTGSLNDIAGRCGFGGGFSLRLHSQLSSEKMTKLQKRLYRERGFDMRRVERIARMVPADAGLFFYMHADIGDLLRSLVESSDEDLIGNAENTIREAWGYTDITPLIEDLEATFHDRFGLIISKNEYPEDPKGPPHDDTPVFTWALVLLPRDMEKVQSLAETVKEHQNAFLIQGREPGDPGVFYHDVAGGNRVLEYWQIFVPGTGNIATLDLPGDDQYFLISNTHFLLADMAGCFFKDQSDQVAYHRLSDDPRFQAYVNAGLQGANALLWLNPRPMSKTLRAIAEFEAQLDVRSAIDWGAEGPKIKRKIMQERWPNEDPATLSPEIQEQLDLLYDEESDRFEVEYVRDNANEMRDAYLRKIDAWEILSCAMIKLAVDPKEIDLGIRVLLPFDLE